MSLVPIQSIQITPRQTGVVARVSAGDFQNLPDDHAREIYAAMAKHPVLEFPRSGLTRDQQLNLTRRLCALADAPADNVEIVEIISQGEYGDYELDWHADGYFMEKGPKNRHLERSDPSVNGHQHTFLRHGQPVEGSA
ncbi:taurine dioxygenase [Microdochium nivale]|nr:taurine dioxygenase [Microdochium nivale]